MVISAKNSSSSLRVTVATLGVTLLTSAPLFAIYAHIFGNNGGSVNGLPAASAIWALSMYNVYWSAGTRYIFRDINEKDVRDGNIEMRINKPAIYPLVTIMQRLGRQSATLFSNTVVSCLLAYLFTGVPPISFGIAWVAEIIILFILGTALSSLVFTAVGLTAFWLDTAQPVMWMVDKSVMVLGGAFMPIALMPGAMRLIAEWSPFGAIMGFSQAFQTDFGERFPALVMSQAIWFVLALILVTLMWSRARRNLSINGG